ncbi:MAG: DNA adenine methylase [Candidatus Cryosericum sp.]
MEAESSSSVTIDPSTNLRPIHYLGSKLRMLDTIGATLDAVDPSLGRVCDLFSGSGTVSKYLSRFRDVTSVDIQEYSRVLCSALLLPATLPESVESFVDKVKNSDNLAKLRAAFDPILLYERKATADAGGNQLEALYDIIENGCLVAADRSHRTSDPSDLSAAITETISLLRSQELLEAPMTMVTRYFGGLYFSYEQSVWIDATLDVAFGYAGSNLALRDLLLAAAISATSSIVNTVGKQFAQPLQVRNANGTLKRGLQDKILSDRAMSFIGLFESWLRIYTHREGTMIRDHEILRMDAYDALERVKGSDVSVVYADPPYTRYHYSRYYHVLETICLRDDPEISTTFPNGHQLSRGVYRKDRYQSPFSIRSQAGSAFDALFFGVAQLKVPFILSYSPFTGDGPVTPRMQTIDQLVVKARRHYSRVCVVSPGHFVHSKLNVVDKNFSASQEAELLIVCQDVKSA